MFVLILLCACKILFHASHLKKKECYPFTQASGTGASGDHWKTASSIYDFSARDIDGNEVCLDKYK